MKYYSPLNHFNVLENHSSSDAWSPGRVGATAGMGTRAPVSSG